MAITGRKPKKYFTVCVPLRFPIYLAAIAMAVITSTPEDREPGQGKQFNLLQRCLSEIIESYFAKHFKEKFGVYMGELQQYVEKRLGAAGTDIPTAVHEWCCRMEDQTEIEIDLARLDTAHGARDAAIHLGREPQVMAAFPLTEMSEVVHG